MAAGTALANTRGSCTDTVGALSSVAMRAFKDAPDAAQAIAGLIHELFGLRVCVISRVDLTKNTLTVLEAFDRVGLGIAKGMVVPADEMPCDFVVRSARALRHTDLSDHPVFSRSPLCTQLGVHSYVGVPLRRSDGTVWGTLAATDTRVHETTDAQLETLVVLARLVAFEFERQEQADALAAQTKELAERLAMVEALEKQRLRAVRLQAVLEAAATVSHEVNNPLTVLQLRLGRLASRSAADDTATQDDLGIAFEAAREIHQVTIRLRQVVNPVSTHYLATGDERMLDLAASTSRS
jgi:GAF domain-containing protein